jgi:hypothetical protein
MLDCDHMSQVAKQFVIQCKKLYGDNIDNQWYDNNIGNQW